MGLAEKKAVQGVKNGDFKTFADNIKNICGCEMTLTVDWESIENHKDCKWIIDNKKYNSFMFDRVVAALKNVCGDDMGRTAVQEHLKEIHMVPSKGDVTFQNGVLTVRNDLTGQGAFDAAHIQATLEKYL